MNTSQAVYFRDQLREARAAALRDAEEFESILFVVERIGSFEREVIGSLGEYKKVLNRLAEKSALSLLPRDTHCWNPPFNRLLEQLAHARNDALHQGAFARHLTTHAIQVALILEDALMDGKDKAMDYMIRNVVTASVWQPISFIRQQMLVNSFSFLPVLDENGEPTNQLIADSSLACYLRTGSRKERLSHKLGDAAKSGELTLVDTTPHRPTDKVSDILKDKKVTHERLPVLIIEQQGKAKRLIGLVSAFDLL